MCSKATYKPVTFDNGASTYCLKEATRIEGPWEFGIRPAQRNKKGDLKRWNEEIAKIGPIKAVEEGLYRIDRVRNLAINIDYFLLRKLPPYEHPTCRGEWHWGVTEAGKTYSTRRDNPGHYLKLQNKWFDGY